MVGIAVAMFIALFGWGAGYFGWSFIESATR